MSNIKQPVGPAFFIYTEKMRKTNEASFVVNSNRKILVTKTEGILAGTCSEVSDFIGKTSNYVCLKLQFCKRNTIVARVGMQVASLEICSEMIPLCPYHSEIWVFFKSFRNKNFKS